MHNYELDYIIISLLTVQLKQDEADPQLQFRHDGWHF